MAPFGPLFKSGNGRRLLDFGCGNGLFLDIAHERGFECYGVDLAADAIEAARQKPSGKHAYHGAPDEIPEIAAGGFHVITMWSVLAHLAQPIEDLTMLRRLLAPDGVLLILTVNAGSLVLKRRLETWGGFTPNHLLFSSPQTLPLLLRRAGFSAVVDAALGTGTRSSAARHSSLLPHSDGSAARSTAATAATCSGPPRSPTRTARGAGDWTGMRDG